MKKRLLYSGTIEIEIIGGLGEKLLNQCMESGICIENICPTHTGFTVLAPLRKYTLIRKLAKRNKCRVRVIGRRGLSFFLMRYKGHCGVLLGLLLAAFVFAWGQRLIWSITFVDCSTAEQIALREELASYGIYEGAAADEDYFESVADQIFVSNDEWSWIRLNFVHGRLVVEKVDRTQQPEMQDTSLTEIVAACDGIILRQEIDGGFAQKQIGQSVAQGEILVSGCTVGKTGALLYGKADAKIYARVEKDYQFTQPLTVSAQMPGGVIERETEILFDGHCITWPKNDLEKDSQFQQTALSSLSFWGFHFPATIKTTIYREAQEIQTTISPQLAQSIAEQKIYNAVASQFDDFKIIERSSVVEQSENSVTLRMHLTLEADIAKVVPFTGFAGNAENEDENL